MRCPRWTANSRKPPYDRYACTCAGIDTVGTHQGSEIRDRRHRERPDGDEQVSARLAISRICMAEEIREGKVVISSVVDASFLTPTRPTTGVSRGRLRRVRRGRRRRRQGGSGAPLTKKLEGCRIRRSSASAASPLFRKLHKVYDRGAGSTPPTRERKKALASDELAMASLHAKTIEKLCDVVAP